MFRCTLLYVHSSIAIILMGKRELIALLNLSSWCLVMVEWLFLTVPPGCLQFVIVVFPDHIHLLYYLSQNFDHYGSAEVTLTYKYILFQYDLYQMLFVITSGCFWLYLLISIGFLMTNDTAFYLK